jgi:hypothetical protein
MCVVYFKKQSYNKLSEEQSDLISFFLCSVIIVDLKSGFALTESNNPGR